MPLLRYRFPKSSSKRLPEAQTAAEATRWCREDEGCFWIEFPDGEFPNESFKVLESLSKSWKGTAYFLGEEEVSCSAWWHKAEPIVGELAPKNVGPAWQADRAWLDWEMPQNCLSGDWNRRSALRAIVAVPEETAALCPVAVVLKREQNGESRQWRIGAYIERQHVGDLVMLYDIWSAMEKHGFEEMQVCGIVYGLRRLRIGLWPLRTLSPGIYVGDYRTPKPCPEYDPSVNGYDAYAAARNSGPRRLSPPPPRAVEPLKIGTSEATSSEDLSHVSTAVAMVLGAGCLAAAVLAAAVAYMVASI